MTASVLEMTNGTTPPSPSSGLLDVFANSNKALSTIDDAGNILSGPTIRENETLAVQPQNNTGVSAAPTGNISTAEKMMGLGLVSGFTITPQVTGRICVIISGVALNSSGAGDGTNVTGKYGTGTAPSNGAAVTGTTFGTTQHFIASTTAGQQGFTCMGIVTGLTLGTAVWLDLALLAVTAGGSTVKDCQVVVFEL
jgi:hypothetical protein